jgi:hydrogenase nickel incorporation protein HypA/HybF
MHELSIARNIVEIAQQYIPAGGTTKVRSVRIRVGELAGVVPESLEFSFRVIAENSPLENAVLSVEFVPARIRCNTCQAESVVDKVLLLCPHCGGRDTLLLSGMELHVIEIELDHNGAETS